jgi:predicted HAD superfamily phosphohydrolase YqeG
MPLSGLTIAWRGTPNLDDWVAYINRRQPKKLILADRVSERKVKALLARLQIMSRREIEKLAKG